MVGKIVFLEEKGMYFTNFTIGCRSKRVGVLVYSIGKGFFIGHREKGYQIQNVDHTL